MAERKLVIVRLVARMIILTPKDHRVFLVRS